MMPSSVTDTSAPDPGQPTLLPTLQQTLSQVTHDINNPLAIISGNAQLLMELSRIMDLDADVAKPIRDIEEASRRLAQTIGRLNEVKELLFEGAAGGDGA